MKKFFIFIFLALNIFCSYSQQLFSKVYYDSLNYNSSYRKAFSVIETSDNGYVFCGEGKGFDLYSAIKVNEEGDTVWTFVSDLSGPTIRDNFWNVIETSDKNYVLVGVSSDSILQKNQAVLFKLNKDTGDTIFVKKFGLPNTSEYFVSVKQTRDNGLIASGKVIDLITSPIGVPLEEVRSYIVKMDKDGNVEWEKNYYSPNGNGVSDIVETPEGDFLIVGGYTTSSSLRMDVFFQKINRFGKLLWRKVIVTPDFNLPYKVCPLKNGYYALTGIKSLEFGTEEVSGFVQVINTNGDLIWEKEYRSASLEMYFKSIKQLENGNLVVCGLESDKNNNLSSSDMYVRRYGIMKILSPINGDVILEKKYLLIHEDTTYHSFSDLIVCKDGGLAMLGYIFDFRVSTFGQSPRFSFWLIKTDCEGNDTIWDYKHCGQAENSDTELAIFPNPTS